jgi:N-acetylmuramoyl-L-alanine amidase
LNNPQRLEVNIYPKPGYRITSTGSIPVQSVPASDEERDSDFSPAIETRQTGLVVVDPGHGGQDRGVDIQLTEAPEKTLNLEIARVIETELRSAGIPSRLTRYRDVNLSIEQRSAVANYYQAKIFLGIHVGASPSSRTRGPIVYYYAPVPKDPEEDDDKNDKAEKAPDNSFSLWKKGQLEFVQESRRLARGLQSGLNRIFGLNNSYTSAPIEVLAAIQAPAVVIELGQLNNPEDQKLLMNPDFIFQIAEVISDQVNGFIPLETARVNRQ